jgi:hypothetical protein
VCFCNILRGYGLGGVGGSKWDMPLPSASAKEQLPQAGGNFPSVAGGRSSFIRNARYAPGVNPSSVSTPLPSPPLSPPIPSKPHHYPLPHPYPISHLPCLTAYRPPQVSPTPGISGIGMGAFGSKAPAASGMRYRTPQNKTAIQLHFVQERRAR